MKWNDIINHRILLILNNKKIYSLYLNGLNIINIFIIIDLKEINYNLLI
jgi:hypothetical protein